MLFVSGGSVIVGPSQIQQQLVAWKSLTRPREQTIELLCSNYLVVDDVLHEKPPVLGRILDAENAAWTQGQGEEVYPVPDFTLEPMAAALMATRPQWFSVSVGEDSPRICVVSKIPHPADAFLHDDNTCGLIEAQLRLAQPKLSLERMVILEARRDELLLQERYSVLARLQQIASYYN